MKRLLLVITILLTAAACVLALTKRAADASQQLQAAKTAWDAETRQLADADSEKAALALQVRALQSDSDPATESAEFIQPPLAQFLASNDVKNASAEIQQNILAALREDKSSSRYVLVAKESLKSSRLKPLSSPGAAKLTDSVCGVLAITPEERRTVEAAFATAYEGLAAWAKANIQRDGPSENMLVRYTIPEDQALERGSTEKLFGEIADTIGEERAQLLQNYFQHNRYSEDGAIGDRTNILEIHRISAPPGLGSRAGWKWADGSESVNTYPEPIKTNRFPTAFSFVFPGGWEDIARKEGFELPEDFKRER